jgi:calcineurin-like phosphoesterase family protein
MLWFTSDHHFFQPQIIDRQDRPFGSLEEMHAVMVARWNDRVAPDDTVYVLGDFAYANNTTPETLLGLFHSLHGTKHLVIGNHDEQHAGVLRLPWESQSYMLGGRLGSHRKHRWFTASHYAMETWRGMARGSLMLHGHSHGTLKRTIPFRFDVGVDVQGFAPVSADALIGIASRQEFVAQDMHGEYDYKAFE